MKFLLFKLLCIIIIVILLITCTRQHLLNTENMIVVKDVCYTIITNLCIFTGTIIPDLGFGVLSTGQSFGQIICLFFNILIVGFLLFLLLCFIFAKELKD